MEKVSIKDKNGNIKRGICIRVSSIIHNSKDKIWNKILDIETLIYICKPMALFKPKEKYTKWDLNTEYVFKLFIYGFIPLGNHRIILEAIEKNNGLILSNEHNNIVKIWKHTILMEIIDEQNTKYTDEVEIYAGVFTLFVSVWAKMFYEHRQKKWKEIAAPAATPQK